MIVVLLVTIFIYLTRFGGEKYIFLTDILALIYSFITVVLGILAVRIYSLKSYQGKALFLIVLGIFIWFLAELIWLIFFLSAYYYVEFLRFFGYIPLIAAFLIVSSISDPTFRKRRKKLIYLFIVFLIFTVIYLNVLPIIFGTTSLLENILNNGYIVADFVLLFGIFLLVRTSLAFKKGSLSIGWLVIAVAFIALFIFDIYFAFNFNSYNFGDLIEIFWLLPYILLSYGFFYHYQAMNDFLKSTWGVEKTEKKPVNMRENKEKLNFSMIMIAIVIGLLLFYLLFSFIPIFSSPKVQEVIKEVTYVQDYVIEYRDDFSVIFTKEVLDTLNKEYEITGWEYLFCLLGNKTDDKIYVNDLLKPESFYKGVDIIIPTDDPACQIENSLGSIHSHQISSCQPSRDDIYSFGEMKNPEPVINAIQCDDGFYIMLMPLEHEAFDFRSLRLTVEE